MRGHRPGSVTHMAFVDSSFWIAYLRASDRHHAEALRLVEEIQLLEKIYVTSGIVHEVVNHLFKADGKRKALETLRLFLVTPNIEIIFLNEPVWEAEIAYFTQFDFSLTDAQIVAAMETKADPDLYSFDKGFGQIEWLTRIF